MTRTLLFSALIPLISAHTRFTTLFVNSQSQGDGTCIRMDMNPSTTTDFISSISSPDMACGVQGDVAVDRTCPVQPGDAISLLHRLWTDGSQPGSIDPSHKGSTAVYMKKIADTGSTSPYTTSASGDGWFKIAWNGYDESSRQWGTEKMIANDGKVEATVPKDLPGGYYLIRSEVLALQNIVDGKVGPQFYAGCAQVYVDGTATGEVSAQTVNIPGYIDGSTSALSYDIYNTVPPSVPYVEFGPQQYGSASARSVRARRIQDVSARSPWRRHGSGRPRPTYNNVADVWETGSEDASDVLDASTSISITSHPTSVMVASTASVSNLASTSAKSATQPATATSVPSTFDASFIGTCPSDTVLTVANQCLTEIPSWSDDTPGSLPKCWAASQQCWDTNEACWNNLSPAINADNTDIGCHAWEAKCNALVAWCQDGNLRGPPAWSGENVAGAASKMVRRNSRRVDRRVVSKMGRGLRG